MSDIVICPNCEGPLTDSWLERAMDGSSGKRCEACTKAYHNPYGAAAELPIFKANLLEAKRHLKRTTEDLVTATTALEAAQAQIAALKVEVAGMMKERDEARSQRDEDHRLRWMLGEEEAKVRAERDEHEYHYQALHGRHLDTVKALDVALADLSQARAELEQANRRAAEMHRRAQATEGAEEHVAKLHAGYAVQIQRYIDRGHAWRAMWKDRYREAAKQLVDAGVPDDWVSPYGTQGKTRVLSELVSRVVAQRDAAIARAEAAEARVRELEARNGR